MRTRFCILSRALFALIMLLFIALCLNNLRHCDRTVPTEEQVLRWGLFAPFISNMTRFEGICFDIDTNYIEFRFWIGHENVQDFLHEVHIRAERSDWVLVTSDVLSRTFQRESRDYPAASHIKQVTIAFDEQKGFFLVTHEHVWPE